MKLLSFTCPSLPMLGSLSNVVCAAPPNNLKGWRVVIRGPSVFLVSPPGWIPGEPMVRYDPKGDTHAFEVPRALCTFRWSSVDFDAVAKHEAPPMGMPAEVLSDEELERATAPRKVAK
jgi:hypothetical protein